MPRTCMKGSRRWRRRVAKSLRFAPVICLSCVVDGWGTVAVDPVRMYGFCPSEEAAPIATTGTAVHGRPEPNVVGLRSPWASFRGSPYPSVRRADVSQITDRNLIFFASLYAFTLCIRVAKVATATDFFYLESRVQLT